MGDFKKLNATTFEQWKSDKAIVEIGDSKQNKGYPQMKSIHHGNKYNVSFRLKEDSYNGEFYERNGVVFYKDGIKTTRLYNKESDDEYGAFEFETEFSQCPEVFNIKYTVQSKGVVFLKQELDERHERAGFIIPDHIKGTYAVYADEPVLSKKLFHIYKTYLIDANGNRRECVMNYEDNILDIDLDEAWMRSAVYPVVFDPTFGYTTIGASTSTITNDTLMGCKFTGAVGTVTSMETYTKATTGTTPIANAIYSDSSGSPNSKLAEDSGNTTVNTTAQWVLDNISLAITAITYWLFWWPGTNDGLLHYDAGGTNQFANKTGQTFESWPSTITSPNFFNVVMSIKANYTTSSANSTNFFQLL